MLPALYTFTGLQRAWFLPDYGGLELGRQAVLAALYTFTGLRRAWFLPGAGGLGLRASGGVASLVHVEDTL